MSNLSYLVLLVDRTHARMVVLQNGAVIRKKDSKPDDVPQKVKHGDDTWDSQDKIFRHIEDHLHRHLVHVGKDTAQLIKQYPVSGIFIGSHRTLFSKIENHIPYPYINMVKGRFVTELKMPWNDILKLAKKRISIYEKG